MGRALRLVVGSKKKSSEVIRPSRRNFLLGAAATLAAGRTNLLATSFSSLPDHTDGPTKIEAVELVELHGRYTDASGINRQQQVNPLDIYDDLRPAPYADKPSGTREVLYTAVYLRI